MFRQRWSVSIVICPVPSTRLSSFDSHLDVNNLCRSLMPSPSSLFILTLLGTLSEIPPSSNVNFKVNSFMCRSFSIIRVILASYMSFKWPCLKLTATSASTGNEALSHRSPGRTCFQKCMVKNLKCTNFFHPRYHCSLKHASSCCSPTESSDFRTVRQHIIQYPSPSCVSEENDACGYMRIIAQTVAELHASAVTLSFQANQ